MCNLLRNAISEILLWPYNPSEGGNAFDDRVALRLSQVTHATILNGRPETLPNGKLVIRQPNGSQNYPDVLLVGWSDNGSEDQNIEIKRSSNGAAVWNSGIPKSSGIYIYNGRCGNISGTTAVLGSSIANTQEIELLETVKTSVHTQKEQYRGMIAHSTSRWELQHIRPMFKENTQLSKWLIHPDRIAREQEVLEKLNAL